MNILSMFIYNLGLAIEYVGVFIVAGSIILAIYHLLLKKKTKEKVRAEMANNIIFGLEFIIAADVLLITVINNLTEVMQLGGIVVVRILLGYSLRKEMETPGKIKKIK